MNVGVNQQITEWMNSKQLNKWLSKQSTEWMNKQRTEWMRKQKYDNE